MTFGSCQPDRAYCFGQLHPGLVEDEAELLAVHGNGQALMWTFHPGNSVAHAAFQSFQMGIEHFVKDADVWNPVGVDGTVWTGVSNQDSWQYVDIRGITSILLDDDCGYCEATLEVGNSPTGQCGLGQSDPSDTFGGVGPLVQPGCSTASKGQLGSGHSLQLFFRGNILAATNTTTTTTSTTTTTTSTLRPCSARDGCCQCIGGCAVRIVHSPSGTITPVDAGGYCVWNEVKGKCVLHRWIRHVSESDGFCTKVKRKAGTPHVVSSFDEL